MAVTDPQPCKVDGPDHDYQDIDMSDEAKSGLKAITGFDADTHEQCTKCGKSMPKD